jgi:hypothetical protein
MGGCQKVVHDDGFGSANHGLPSSVLLPIDCLIELALVKITGEP